MAGPMVEVELREVLTQTDRGQTCAMLLEELHPETADQPRRVLPIYIGPVEAVALGRAALGDRTPRPQTHDLVVNVAQALGGNLLRVLITRLERHGDAATFIGALEYLTESGNTVRADSRPSDALVIATLCGVPVFVASSVMAAAGVPLGVSPEESSSDGDEDVEEDDDQDDPEN